MSMFKLQPTDLIEIMGDIIKTLWKIIIGILTVLILLYIILLFLFVR